MKIVPYSGPINLETVTDINLSQSDVGNNPWVNLYIGRLKFAFDDLSIGGGNSAISLCHVYDSHMAPQFEKKIIGLGNKWRLNLTQIVLRDNWDADGNSIYKYIDEMGTIHRLVSFSGGWYDDCNAKTVLKQQGDYFELTDGVGNRLRFDKNGYLCENYSCHSDSICKVYKYDQNRLISVYDKRTWSESKQLARTRIELEYDDNDLLTSMTSYGDYTTRLEKLEY